MATTEFSVAKPPSGVGLDGVRKAAMQCRACPLWEPATQTVFGKGPADARVVFVGEQPGDVEDRKGEPFVGPAGKLLDRALVDAGIDRDETYVTNAVKHFRFTQSGKRRLHQTPGPEHVAACRPWLDAQIRLVDPRVVVTLGNFAAKTLLETTTGITRLRGQTYPFQGRVLLPTFHPAAALHAQGRRTAGPSPLEAMEGDFKVLAELLAARAPVDDDRPTEQLGLF